MPLPLALCFDLFGTLFDLSAVPKDEIRDYLRQCVDNRWRQLELPPSWSELPALPDVAEGLTRLSVHFRLATCSNATALLAKDLFAYNNLPDILFTDLSEIRRYKPHPHCYLYVCQRLGLTQQEVMMITANPRFGPYPFGDIHIAGAIGMQTQLIRQPDCPADLLALADQLEC